MLDRQPLPPVDRRHLDALSGPLGIMQHARGPVPDPAHGYCTDDVARSLQVDLLHARELGWDAVADSASRNIRFLDEALDPTSGRFRNFRGADGAWAPGIGSEDAHGRALLALGETIGAARDPRLVDTAGRLFAAALPAAGDLEALRARASVVLACDAVMRAAPSRAVDVAYRVAASRLVSTFDARRSSSWPWPERLLTYENALPARALLLAGDRFGARAMSDAGLEVLDWLIAVQTASSGHLSPIGNGWWPFAGPRSRFDQQPIEAYALLLAAEAAYELTGDTRYESAVERAFLWFLGQNDVGVAVADPAGGACYDGLTATGVNTNQGAESTLVWLIALEHVRAMRAAPPRLRGRPLALSGPVLVASA